MKLTVRRAVTETVEIDVPLPSYHVQHHDRSVTWWRICVHDGESMLDAISESSDGWDIERGRFDLNSSSILDLPKITEMEWGEMIKRFKVWFMVWDQ